MNMFENYLNNLRSPSPRRVINNLHSPVNRANVNNRNASAPPRQILDPRRRRNVSPPPQQRLGHGRRHASHRRRNVSKDTSQPVSPIPRNTSQPIPKNTSQPIPKNASQSTILSENVQNNLKNRRCIKTKSNVEMYKEICEDDEQDKNKEASTPTHKKKACSKFTKVRTENEPKTIEIKRPNRKICITFAVIIMVLFVSLMVSIVCNFIQRNQIRKFERTYEECIKCIYNENSKSE
jgi:hypothetical protein